MLGPVVLTGISILVSHDGSVYTGHRAFGPPKLHFSRGEPPSLAFPLLKEFRMIVIVQIGTA